MCFGCSTTAYCASHRTLWTIRIATGSALQRTRTGAYYAVLAAKGFIAESTLDDMASFTSPLATTGPTAGSRRGDLLRVAGSWTALAIGVAHGLRAQVCPGPGVRADRDAELDEGSNHEAIAYAGATGLASITAIVVDNDSATHGWPVASAPDSP